MRRFSRAGLPLTALAVAGLYLPLAGRGLGQTPINPPAGFQPINQPGFAPAAGPGMVPSQPVRPAPPPPSPYEIKGAVPGGPFMVLAATYTGPHAVYLAEQVVRQLQAVRRAPWKGVYVLNFADLQRRKEEEEYDKMVRNNPNIPYRRRITRIEQQCGVLVGGYPSWDDASKAMRYVKQLPPPTVKTPDGRDAADILHEGAEGTDRNTGKPGTAQTGRGVLNPFSRAFVIRNPIVPRQKDNSTAQSDLKLWKALNEGENYSLLKCRKAYTLVIKYYEGPSALQDSATPTNGGIVGKLFGQKSRVVLNASAQLAHEMAKALDQSGVLRSSPSPLAKYNARIYVLHMRNGSVVTVGGFDRLDDPQLKGLQLELMRFRLDTKQNPNSDGGASLQLFAQPMPMRVPR